MCAGGISNAGDPASGYVHNAAPVDSGFTLGFCTGLWGFCGVEEVNSTGLCEDLEVRWRVWRVGVIGMIMM